MMMLTMPFHDRIGFESTGMVVGYTTMVLAFLLIYFGVRSDRDTVLEEELYDLAERWLLEY